MELNAPPRSEGIEGTEQSALIASNRLTANRKNALRSTGPKTSAGKSRSSKNGTRHGLLSREAVMPNEDRRTLERLRAYLLTDLAPEGALESLLADRIVACAWRMRRLIRVETIVFEEGRWTWDGEDGGLGHSFSRLATKDGLGILTRYEAAIERGLYRALHELQRLQAERSGLRPSLPVVVDVEISGSQAP